MKTKSQKWRILHALMQGKEVSRLWASQQVPMISQPGNRCNELIKQGVPIRKKMIYPGNAAHYMAFWMDQNGVNTIRGHAEDRIKELTA